MEIVKIDLGVVIETDSKPVFFNSSSDELFIPYPEQISTMMSKKTYIMHRPFSSEEFLDDIDKELATVWRATKEFCSLINRSTQTKRKLSEGTLFETIASIMYRLLYISFASDSLDEAIRLCLLAFATHVFLQWPSARMQNAHLSTRFRGCLVNLTVVRERLCPILLWLLMIGAISVFGEADDQWLKPWLRSSIEMCEVGSWDELRDIMGSVIWINLVYDKPGKDIFDSAMLYNL